ncbi:hypothetical protein EVAR_12854_1 [Eumeta japonica]|uniref:Uncharacterized protein n=1 Tax=Eumeta variegata TaxID=151549 RepID=A0A4C1TWP8_EUMVA|nr:hypothetical protein EVAR_12854_1 [Eumeta japonica]
MFTGEFKEGRPESVAVSQNIDAVWELIMQDRHVTYREMKAPLGISDESRMYEYDTETKQQSTVWVFQDEPNPTKVIRAKSTLKQMVDCFFGISGPLVVTVPLENRKMMAEVRSSRVITKPPKQADGNRNDPSGSRAAGKPSCFGSFPWGRNYDVAPRVRIPSAICLFKGPIPKEYIRSPITETLLSDYPSVTGLYLLNSNS